MESYIILKSSDIIVEMFRPEECLLLAFLPWEIRLAKGNLKPKQRANWQRCTYPLRSRWIESALALVAN